MKKPLISEELQKVLNSFISKELYAESFYRSMANCMQYLGYFGFQKFFLSESENEKTHYQKLVNFCNDMGFCPDIPTLDPILKAGSPKDAFYKAYNLELGLGEDYMNQSRNVQSKNLYVYNILMSFVEEQRTSIGEYGDLISKIDICGDNSAALLEFDEDIIN